jgi:hypothetical protein
MMVFLSGPRRGVGRVKLHDPPPGYRPPRRSSIPLKDRQRLAREYLVVIRIATVVLVLAAAATIVIIFVLIAPHM